jgi:superfamily II DNA or RNA helicase
MRKNIEISDEKINEFLEQFYSYFESGYAFEEFLKVYLEKIGLDEVVVTQRSSDGGIDLEAVRYGVGGFAGADAVDYFVQAKRNKPGTTIPIEKVRALRGVMPSGSKGIFITTASYSKKTEEFVDADPSRPIILIDGKSLVESCIDNEIGFVFTPVFSKNAMDALKDECDDLVKEDGTVVEENEGVKLVVDKQISANDIRARILRLPKAVSNLLPYDAHKVKHDNGILHAATAFGKTVVCSAVIAEKKVNTLILLESSALIEQWKDALNKFLIIDEELPQYKTKTGRLRTRKSLIGTLQGAHDSMTGIIDIAMAGSLCKKGEYHKLLNHYGLVLIDECHHCASETIANVLKEVKARYVYGVTATPKRGDGLEKINYMLIGPIRYSYTAKEKAMEQGIQHLVYPRFTRTVPPRGVINGKMHPNEAYDIIHNNDIRDEQIIEDIKNCVSAGRTPVVLSRYKDHSEKLYKRLKDYADHVFLMTGNNSKKEHKKILEQMHQVDKAESLILIATGSLVGEGFDFPRLDTLFMATPVSFRGVVEQYAGRLNRDYAGKENVIIYDYVDNHITMFNNMYMKRLKAYKQIGYEIAGGLHNDKQTANAIYDGDNYAENYHKDLLDANKNIIISSPAISGTKVYELINLLKEKQLSGVQITIVTWAPDSYGFGDAAYWMQLHEEMRKAGFYIKTVEESCERFAVIDQEVVWYGNINLLANGT